MNNRIQKSRWNLLLRPGKGEVEAAQLLSAAGFEVYRQHWIAGFFVDIAIPAIGLAVEIDHPGKKVHRRRERRRQSAIEKQGWKVIRVRNDCVSGVVSQVRKHMAPVCSQTSVCL